MIPGITNVTGTTTSDGFSAALDSGDVLDKPVNHLDSADNLRLLNRLEDWWTEAREAHAENRREMMIDADYYDCIQWRAADAQVLIDRGQAPLTFPVIKQMCDWIIGTERRTRIDWDVLPRKDSDVEIADVKKQVMKWVSDINGAGWERSQQFADVVKVGIGWTEECYNNDRFEEPVTIRYQDWKGLWWDPYSRSNVMRDCRYITRAKWLDLDYAISMFPDRADELIARASDNMDSSMEMLVLETSLPQMFYDTPNPFRSSTTGPTSLFGSSMVARRARKRVLMLETWYKRAINSPLLLGDNSTSDLNGTPYDPMSDSHQVALARGVVSLVDSVSEQMWCALWTPGALMRVYKTPYGHNKFPFTPAWGYRRHRDGMPYGPIRPSRDSQDEYNKRRSKILFDLSTNLVVYTSDAMDEADEDTNLEEAKRPDGEVRLKPGKMEEFKIDRGTDRVRGQIEMLAEAKENIYESSGVTRENAGTSTGDQSGRAILAKQQQGAVTTAELFDNYRQATQESGQKTLSNAEKFLSAPKIVRIAGEDGARQWVSINQPSVDPMTGQVIWENDITASAADFIIDETDYRETVRMAQSEMLFELIGKLPPEMAMALIDVAVDMTDLPNKAALVARMRSVNGQMAPGAENTPEAQRTAANKQAQADASAQLQQQLEQANVELTQAKAAQAKAKAALDQANTKKTNVAGKAAAMETAGMVHAAPKLAPAADTLWDPQTAFPASPNQFSTAI